MRGIVFDMDGLMIDSEGIYWAVSRQMALEQGKTVSDETLGRMMGRAPLESVELYAREVGLAQAPDVLMRERDARVLQIIKTGVQPMPGLREVLDAFHPRFKLAIATSAPMRFVDLIVDGLKIRDDFQVLQTSDDITHGKPNPEIYLKAMARLGIPPAQCVVLEDSSNGALAGKRAGAYTIAVPSKYTRSQDFSFVDYIAADLLDAKAHVESLG
ncbi:MAG TPA: HAD family phosphatase [Tepidisphaeraceae bacterium]|nr:HAD family phosphatase [Tepidisphaeraceae bacterium]